MSNPSSPKLQRQLSPRDTVDQIASRRLKTNRQVQMLSNVQLTSYMKSIGLRPEGTPGVRATRKAWEKQCFDRRTELIGKFGNSSETKTHKLRQSRLAARRRRASAHVIRSPSEPVMSQDTMNIPKLEVNKDKRTGRGRKKRSASLATGRKRFGKSYSTPNPGEWLTAAGGRRRQRKEPEPKKPLQKGAQKKRGGGGAKSRDEDTQDRGSEKSSQSPEEQKRAEGGGGGEKSKNKLKKRKVPEPTTESEKRGALAREEIQVGTVSEDPTAPMNVLSKIRKRRSKKKQRSRSMPAKNIPGRFKDGRPVALLQRSPSGQHVHLVGILNRERAERGGPEEAQQSEGPPLERSASSPRRNPGGASWLRGRAAPQKRAIKRGWNKSHPEAEAKENAGNADGKKERKPRAMSLGAGQRRKKALLSASERKQAAVRGHEANRETNRHEAQPYQSADEQVHSERSRPGQGGRVTSRRVSAAARRVQEQQREAEKAKEEDETNRENERRARQEAARAARTERPEEKVDGAAIPSRFMARRSRRTGRNGSRRQEDRSGPNPIVPLPEPDANNEDDLPNGPSIVVPKDQGSSWAKDFEASKSREDKKSPEAKGETGKNFKLGSVADDNTSKTGSRRKSPKSGKSSDMNEKTEEDEINPGSVLAAIRKSRKGKGKKKRRRKQTA